MNLAALESLTPKERDCLRASLGRTVEQVGRELGISANTVRTHIASARAKLGSPPKGDAARALVAWEEGHPFRPNPEKPMVVPTENEPVVVLDRTPAAEITWLRWLPIRTGGTNDLNPLARSFWIFMLAVLGSIGFGALASGAHLISDLFR